MKAAVTSGLRHHTLPVLAAMCVASSILSIACDESNAVKEPPIGADSGAAPTDGGSADAAADTGSGEGGPTDCVQNPKTHLEILNACTDAVKITKNPTLAKLLPDGGLPPLP